MVWHVEVASRVVHGGRRLTRIDLSRLQFGHRKAGAGLRGAVRVRVDRGRMVLDLVLLQFGHREVAVQRRLVVGTTRLIDATVHLVVGVGRAARRTVCGRREENG